MRSSGLQGNRTLRKDSTPGAIYSFNPTPYNMIHLDERQHVQSSEVKCVTDDMIRLSSQKCQFSERRITTVENLVNATTSIPDNVPIHMPNVQHSMLWDEFLVGSFLLPCIHADLQLSLKSIHEPDDIVLTRELRVPVDTIDDICV